VAIACWSSLNVYLSALGQDILDKKVAASRYEDTWAKVVTARGKLAQIAEQADTTTLDAMARAAKSRADDLEEADTRRMGGKVQIPSLHDGACTDAIGDPITVTRQGVWTPIRCLECYEPDWDRLALTHSRRSRGIAIRL
jgi:hypothetical protein